MPRKRAVGKVRYEEASMRHLKHGVWCQLVTGVDPGRPDIPEFGEGVNFREAEAKAVWDAIGTGLMALFAERYPEHTAWGLELFGSPKGGRRAA